MNYVQLFFYFLFVLFVAAWEFFWVVVIFAFVFLGWIICPVMFFTTGSGWWVLLTTIWYAGFFWLAGPKLIELSRRQ